MATTDTRNQPLNRPLGSLERREEDRNSRALWTVIVFIVLAALAYAVYSAYHSPAVPADFTTSATNASDNPNRTDAAAPAPSRTTTE